MGCAVSACQVLEGAEARGPERPPLVYAFHATVTTTVTSAFNDGRPNPHLLRSVSVHLHRWAAELPLMSIRQCLRTVQGKP